MVLYDPDRYPEDGRLLDKQEARRARLRVGNALGEIADEVQATGLTRLRQLAKEGLSFDTICWIHQHLLEQRHPELCEELVRIDGPMSLIERPQIMLPKRCWQNQDDMRKDMIVVSHWKGLKELGQVGEEEFNDRVAQQIDPHLPRVLYLAIPYMSVSEETGEPIELVEWKFITFEDVLDNVLAKLSDRLDVFAKQHKRNASLVQTVNQVADDLEMKPGWSVYNLIERLAS